MSKVDIDHCVTHALSTKVSALRQIPVFQQCRDSIVHKVAQQLQTRFLEPGEIVCRSGEESDHVFLLAFGSVQVWSDGQESADLCDAGIIGDPRVLFQPCVENQHNVVAKTFCQMHMLTSSQFRQVAGIKDDVQDLSRCLEQLKIPWPTTRKPSFLRAAKAQLRVVQFVNAISAGRKKAPAVAPPPRPPEPKPEAKKESAAKRRQTAKLQTAKLHGKLKANKDKLDEGNEERETSSGQKDTLTFNSEAQKMEISKSLQAIDFFSTLDTFSFERLIALFQKKFWRKNEPLLTEGKPAKAMHVVLQGDVNIIIGGKVLNKLGSNSVVGERSVLSSTSGDPAPCGATVTAASPIVMTASATRVHLQDLFFKDAGLLEHFQSRFDVERHRRGVTSFRNVKLFREADPGFTQALEVAVKERVYNDGEYLVTEGVECHEAVMLCRGTVNILSDDVVVATMTVEQMEDSVIFGEFTLMGIWDAPRASIVAVNTCLVQVIHQDALRQCLDLYPDESFIFRELVEIRLDKIYQQEAEVKRQKSQASLGGNSNPEQDADVSNKAEAGLRGNSPQARPPAMKRKTLPRGIREVKDFKVLSVQCMRELELYLHKRLFMKDQVIVHQGTDLQDVYVLQQGTCEAKVFGASFEIMKGHCVIGGLPSVLTKKVFTTVVATEPCFVVKISQRHFNAMLDKYPDDRKKLFAAANRAFSTMCDDFQQNVWIAQAFQEQLGAMPCLAGAGVEFLAALAHVLEPRLLLPAQEIFLASGKEDSPDLYFVFEGHFHCLQKGAVMGTISPKMVFGVLEVFGINDVSSDMRIYSDEICKVGVLTQAQLCDLLHEFPQERGKFEKLVHSLMEDSVNHHLVMLPFLSGLNNQQILTVCHLLDRRFLLPDVTIVKEGDGGDFMMVLNCGKVEVLYKDVSMGKLLAGKAFGVSQMMGLHTRYHATLKAKSTCHILLIFWHMLSGLISTAADLTWVQAMRRQAQEIYDSESAGFARKLQQKSNMARSRHLLMDNVNIVTGLWSLRDILQEWYQVARSGILSGRDDSMTQAASPMQRQTTAMSTGGGGRLPTVEASAFPNKHRGMAARPVRFNQNLRWADLPRSNCKKEFLKWELQSGRLDIWKGFTGSAWLHTVRDEVAQEGGRHK
ncbi:cAMP-dependent protein kinase regulatory subunit [Symbiodinium microadriaticum]|uniref:cAMP-dependent protein kinase regulatory subunit n=1 Tax=Symbiodinium microadriaticum TaxID=2951 RepID=A0A1Q9E9U2_SYMMI|nr:cAMP-dependent protein kinase regulatory subunit [Symbiodinium microadriaticum]CAE7252369.1 PKAR [Symbiodinium microadriaticum]CAE7949447.1 PKAR [Symbiodinium sp. KB8]